MFNKRTLGPIIPLASAALFATGCGAQGASEPPQEDLHGAPSVQNPLNTAAFQKDPCKSLSPDQIQSTGMGDASGKADLEANGGPACRWTDYGSGADLTKVGVTYLVQSKGLKDLYSNRQNYPYFKELPSVNGYPAVANDNAGTPPEQSGRCAVDVGVSDELSFTTQFTAMGGPDKTNPCGKAQQVAGEVVNTLKSGK